MTRLPLLAGLVIGWLSHPTAMGQAAAPDLSVPLTAGETLLQEIGIYRVGWQSYGGDPEEMPLAWSGHFDDRTGVSCLPWGKVLGRPALLLHSPWRVPPGRTWVEYLLALPNTQPIQLRFGIAMGPDVAVPGKSDGVTFSVYLGANGQERELLRQHHALAEWLDYTFDLSAHAGRTVTLRLQVEPGPKNSASFDYSFFGNARIAVGEPIPSSTSLLPELTSTRASQATASASRAALSNSPKNGVTPSNLLPFTNKLERSGDRWTLAYQAADCDLTYTFTPLSGTLDDFSVRADKGRPFQPGYGGGIRAQLRREGKEETILLRGGRAVEANLEGDRLKVLWEYQLGGQPLQVAWSFGILGKALLVSARCPDPVLSGLSLGHTGLAPLRRTMPVPYLLGNIHYLPAQKVFVGRYLDWTKSHSSMCPQGEATYEPKTDGTRNPLFESGYIAVSPEVGEVLPNIPHPASPFLELLGPRIMLDIWGHHQGSYAGDAAVLRVLKDHGVDHLAIIQHDWQRFGYDVKLPDHLPPNPRYGGEEGITLFGRAANEAGYLWSLHENYIDLYPDAPSYDPAARVLRADGSPSPAWYNPGTRVQSFGLKCNRALEFAKQSSPEIHRRYQTTAAYLDVHTCVPPWHQLDHEAGQPMAAMALAKVHFDTALFQFERDAHGGPLFGEGANHFFWAGRCDGVEAQVAGGEDHAPFLDFDLLKIHPQMVNHGLGYYERWFRRGYEHQLGHDTGTMEQIDKYRAMELAYGHAGFVGSPHVHNILWVVREHHLVHPVQRLHATARPVEILYEVEGRLVTASAALACGDTSRQRIRYDSGLILWVNWRPAPWTVTATEQPASSPALRKRAVSLPQWGFLALGPHTEVHTALQDGVIGDYAECPEYLFADARTCFPMPYRREPTQIEPRLREFKYLGDDRAQVTYEWVVGETPGQDYNCFVHAVNREGAAGPDHIVFQQDHALPKPTSQWRPGEVIVDGPHQLRVSGKFDAYDLTIGLFKGDRLRLQGLRDPQNRIVIAHLQLRRESDRIAGITAAPPAAARLAGGVPEADFTAHLNPPGTWVDFGAVATDGAIKINKEQDQLVVFPYPRDRAFRASLDLERFAPKARSSRVQVRACAAGDQRDLGPGEFRVEGGRLLLTFGQPGTGRYVIRWD